VNLNRQPDFSTQLYGIPSGVRGIQATLDAMSTIVRSYKLNPDIRRTAIDVIRAWPEKDYPAEAQALQTFVRDTVRYTQDIDGVETLQTPDVTLHYHAGDCDDKSILLASLLASVGHRTRFVALGFERAVYCHVLVECNIGGVWLPLETTERVEAGWTPPDMPYRLIKEN